MVGSAVHASGYDGRLGPRDHFASLYGFLGYSVDSLDASVSLFFVLSGYLLSRRFLRAFVDGAPMPSIGRYARNRALRILPAFWVVLALAFILVGTRGDSFWQSVGLAGFVTNFASSGMHVGFGQPWSLAVEARFYVLLPLATLVLVGGARALGPRLARSARIVLLLVLIVVGFEASARYALHDAPYFDSFAANASAFAPGMILAVLEHILPSWVRAHARIRYVAAAMFVAGLVLLLTWRYVYLHGLVPVPVRYVVPAATGLIVAGPLLWQWSGSAAWRALDNRVLRWIGARSYSLYLVHSLVLFRLAPYLVAGGYKLTPILLGAVTLPCSLLASALVYRYVELPALRLKSGGRRPHTAVLAPAVPVVGDAAGLGTSTIV